MHFNLAPLAVRRDIAMLGLVHRAALLQGPPVLWKFFRREVVHKRASRHTRHTFQLAEWPRGRDLQIFRRSAFGTIKVYNLLPQSVVEAEDVKTFQCRLTDMVRARLTGGDHGWRALFSPRVSLFQCHPLWS